ncbi:hypothetical protein OAQ99_05775 [Candidatus Kapabacteria bacterium]|nr:hypothetical protein [Candidatus Kapabacteria bacterium]
MKYILLFFIVTIINAETLPDSHFLLKRGTTIETDSISTEFTYGTNGLGDRVFKSNEFTLNTRYGIDSISEFNFNYGYSHYTQNINSFMNSSFDETQLGIGGKYIFSRTQNSIYTFVSNLDLLLNYNKDLFLTFQVSKYNQYKKFDFGINLRYITLFEDFGEYSYLTLGVPFTFKLNSFLINVELGSNQLNGAAFESMFINTGFGVKFLKSFIADLHVITSNYQSFGSDLNIRLGVAYNFEAGK